MKVHFGFEEWSSSSRTSVTLGNFDGVHLGHQKILARVIQLSRSAGIPAVAITFDPVPKKILQPDTAPPLIQTLEQRLNKLERLGLTDVIVVRFSKPFAQKKPEEFAREFLVNRLKLRFFVIGEGFSFGHQKQGDLTLLRKLGSLYDFEVDAVSEVRDDGTRISSSQIRKYILHGQMESASRFLGEPFTMTGVVVEGEQLGGKLGIPTANLQFENEIVPAHGVYVCNAVASGETYSAVTNIGVRPTFEGKKLTVEAHLLDFSGNLYGSRMDLQFLSKLRDERKFENVDALKTQIMKDIQLARNSF
jgi:riboflavin kinase/FMN adenylyltransferase